MASVNMSVLRSLPDSQKCIYFLERDWTPSVDHQPPSAASCPDVLLVTVCP